MISWFSGLDLGCNKNWRLKTEVKDVTCEGFTITLDTWSDTEWHTASCNWIAHSTGQSRIVSGSYNSGQVRPFNKPTKETHGQVIFPKPFARQPFVFTALTSIDFDHGRIMRFKMPITNITNTGFSWALDTWDASTLYSASASYIAFEPVW